MESHEEELNRLRALQAALSRRPWHEVERAFTGADAQPSVIVLGAKRDDDVKIVEIDQMIEDVV